MERENSDGCSAREDFIFIYTHRFMQFGPLDVEAKQERKQPQPSEEGKSSQGESAAPAVAVTSGQEGHEAPRGTTAARS